MNQLKKTSIVKAVLISLFHILMWGWQDAILASLAIVEAAIQCKAARMEVIRNRNIMLLVEVPVCPWSKVLEKLDYLS